MSYRPIRPSEEAKSNSIARTFPEIFNESSGSTDGFWIRIELYNPSEFAKGDVTIMDIDGSEIELDLTSLLTCFTDGKSIDGVFTNINIKSGSGLIILAYKG